MLLPVMPHHLFRMIWVTEGNLHTHSVLNCILFALQNAQWKLSLTQKKTAFHLTKEDLIFPIIQMPQRLLQQMEQALILGPACLDPKIHYHQDQHAAATLTLLCLERLGKRADVRNQQLFGSFNCCIWAQNHSWFYWVSGRTKGHYICNYMVIGNPLKLGFLRLILLYNS